MSSTFRKQRHVLVQTVRTAEGALSRFRERIDNDLPRTKAETAVSFAVADAKVELPLAFARVVVELAKFQITLYSGKRGW